MAVAEKRLAEPVLTFLDCAGARGMLAEPNKEKAQPTIAVGFKAVERTAESSS